jgi:hypothetical protein
MLDMIGSLSGAVLAVLITDKVDHETVSDRAIFLRDPVEGERAKKFLRLNTKHCETLNHQLRRCRAPGLGPQVSSQAGHIPRCDGSCECYALSLALAVGRAVAVAGAIDTPQAVRWQADPHLAGDSPRPVRAGSRLAFVFWPECP